jgi:hypothetical protein
MNIVDVNAEFVSGLSDWDTFITFTCRGGNTDCLNLRSRVQRFMRHQVPDATYFAAYEPHKKGGYHAHLISRLGKDRIKKASSYKKGDFQYCDHIHKKALRFFGRTEIVPVKDKNAVTTYCAKRVSQYTNKNVEAGEYDIQFGDCYIGRKEKSLAVPL